MSIHLRVFICEYSFASIHLKVSICEYSFASLHYLDNRLNLIQFNFDPEPTPYITQKITHFIPPRADKNS